MTDPKNPVTPLQRDPQHHVDDLVTRLNLKTPVNKQEFSQLSPRHDDGSSSDSNDNKFIVDESLGDILQQEPSSMELLGKSSLFFEKQQQQYIQQLKDELNHRDEEIEKIRIQGKRKEAEYEEKFLEIQHRHELQVMKLTSQANLSEKKYKDVFKKTEETIELLNQKIQQLEQNKPIYDRQLDEIKKNLEGDLQITENVYLDFKDKPYTQLSLKEFVQLKMYEVVSNLKEQVLTLKKERDILSENLDHTNSNYERLQRDHQHYTRINEEIQIDLKRQVSDLEKTKDRLSRELQEQIRFYEQFKAKESIYDDSRNQANQYREEAYKSQRLYEETEAQLKHIKEELEHTSRKLITVTQQYELVQQDKMFLTKQNEDINERQLRLQKDLDYKQEKYRELKKQKNELYERLLDIKQTSKTEYEQQLQQEIDKLRKQTEKDLESIRANAKEGYERENRMIRDSKEQSERESIKLRNELSETKEMYDQLLMEHRNLCTKSERQLAELQSQIKLKTFETERASAQLLESSTNLTKARSEIDILQKKLAIVKDEYYTLQVENNKTVVNLEAELRTVKEKLHQYEDMEKALNEGLDDFGALDGLSPDEEKLQVMNLKQIPTNHAQRLQYCLMIIKKLGQAEKKIDALSHALQVKSSEALTYQKKVERIQSKLDLAARPSHYLVDSITERDATIEKLKNENEKLASLSKKLKEEVDRLKKRKEILEKDVEKLLDRVQFSNKIRGALSKHNTENIPPESNDNDALLKDLVHFTK